MSAWRGFGRRRAVAVGAALTLVVVVAVVGYLAAEHFRYYRVTAYFTSTTGLYVGDDVRVVGVDVGRVTGISPDGDRMRVQLKLARSVPVAADAKAVIVAQSLVSARFVQLTPAVTGDDGEALGDGAEIGLDRTAVPVEWDQVKEQLGRAADALGPKGTDRGPVANLLDGAGTALQGNGAALGESVVELSQAMSTLSSGGGDLFGTIRGLQTFTTALAASNEQIVQFQGRLATVTGVLADGRTQLAPALADLDGAITDVQRFVAQNRTGLTEQVSRLADVAQVLVDKRDGLEKVLHLAPTALSNYYNVYRPAQGAMVGVPAFQNVGNPIDLICGGIAGLANETSDKGAELCAQYLGPLLNTVRANYPDLSINPTRALGATPDQLVYSEPQLVPAAAAPPALTLPTVPVAPDLAQLMTPGRGTR
ncbi:MCE family protein [Rhodococcus tukisamuensis]|uniref:Phospholipid/cholesterol/gamma-HCH transport system substrate-binding protein n=1 Tax=Rhodococcus tukisamuensis TaxID=168276 RepID=A0A1G6RA73_9NOCA|nr:MCE family protein [Rhodococcus tukisamuensis]SDD01530.1 phospholipid/cholesterol/gamma-HCH transport system substrate-binding protein [Rhodococcus tukisamuensis]